MHGIVNAHSVTTIGGVVRPGEEIAQIIPLGDEFYVEARVQPKDIANVQSGQEATVKLSAYDYSIWGSFKGVVELVSADTFKDDRVRDGDPDFRVTVRLDMTALTERQRRVEMRPGMIADVALHAGSKTILHDLLKPRYKSREAIREPWRRRGAPSSARRPSPSGNWTMSNTGALPPNPRGILPRRNVETTPPMPGRHDGAAFSLGGHRLLSLCRASTMTHRG